VRAFEHAADRDAFIFPDLCIGSLLGQLLIVLVYGVDLRPREKDRWQGYFFLLLLPSLILIRE
jgi:hypothetical protein